jgi:hypothetical protein
MNKFYQLDNDKNVRLIRPFILTNQRRMHPVNQVTAKVQIYPTQRIPKGSPKAYLRITLPVSKPQAMPLQNDACAYARKTAPLARRCRIRTTPLPRRCRSIATDILIPF